ncbi:histidine triad nucleotide-binding protein [Mesoterricola silvestris]|uniref:Histidine triad nucleotide-binding protein n=1 Tax=Mesoterricola silvestris TaxID=2927979 RepID=A0AA48KAJ9_9BACT|nr:histidine triad nucleotide-binding protein [Mesoterricola silvestris]BDU73387.1 histidine triad nucleotide-binding protein [Mesoterricola silvestris]
MSDPNCVFCRIASGQIPATILFQDENLLAFRDIAPQAPTHIVLIPRAHFSGLNDLTPERAGLVGEIALVAKDLAAGEGLAASGWRLVSNAGPDAGQTVFHLHFHLLGGRPMGGRMA